MRVRIALAAGLALMAIALVVTLSRAPLVTARTNIPGASAAVEEEITTGSGHQCLAGEALPAETSAVRLEAGATTLGPPINLKIYSGSSVIAEGNKHAGWRGIGVTVALQRPARGTAHTTVCYTVGPVNEAFQIYGLPATGVDLSSGPQLSGKIAIEYLRRGRQSWWSLARGITSRLGLGRATAGTWIALAPAALMIAIAMLTCLLIVGELAPVRSRRRLRLGQLSWSGHALPVPVLICMVIAVANAVCWSIVTPLFQIEDEPDHFAYVQQLAERRQLPLRSEAPYSPEEEVALRDLSSVAVRANAGLPSLALEAQQQRLERDLGPQLSRLGTGAAGNAASEPPLYYALQVIPYELGSAGSILLRMQLMRLLSALMAAASACFVYLFIRELLPGTPWVWTVGGLSAALAPLLGSISGSINPDAMLCAVASACFYCIARGFRRGLTRRLALSIGAVLAIGFMTKLNFVGLAPGVIAGLATLAYRARRPSGGAAYRWFLLAIAVAFGPILVFSLVSLVRDGGAQSLTSAIPKPLPHGSPLAELSYVWQSYLPRLPGMAARFPGISTWREVWFAGFVGSYGWDAVFFSDRIDNAALIPAGVILGLCMCSLSVRHKAVRAHLAELTVYATVTVGLLLSIGISSYTVYPHRALEFHPLRYLLPLIALGAAGVALAARGAGRRWGPTVGTLIVLLVLAHDIFSQLLVVSRYYG